MSTDRIRKIGAGRPYIEEKYPNLHDVFLDIMDNYTAGCPMNSDVKWTYLTQEELVSKLSEHGIEVSIFTVRTLLQIHAIKKRKMDKVKTIKNADDRDAQFHRIHQLINQFCQLNQPITSIDTKNKEPLGHLYRLGTVYTCDEPIRVYDHDYPSLRLGQVVPHGIYDITRNEAMINLGISKDTAEFVFDSLLIWWNTYGITYYHNAHEWLILCDSGGSNNCRHYVFKQTIQKLADLIEIDIRIAHYPSYCSKYNPIEHRVFPFVTKALQGIPLDSVDTVKNLIENRANTKTGLKVFANTINKIYETGKKATQDFLENMPIVFDEFLPKWNYKAIPTSNR